MADNDDLLGNMGESPSLQGGPTLADQEKAMQKGKGTMLIMGGGVVLAILVGLFFLLSGGDEKEAYSEFGKNINGMKITYFDGFWGCALKGANLKDIKSAEALVAKINMRGTQAKSVYAKLLRDKCAGKLEELESKLDLFIAPEGFQTHVKESKKAVSQLRSALSAYISYMDDPKAKYDEEIARPKIKEIARGWIEYKKAHIGLNQELKTKLE